MATGKVKWFKDEKGYGFITPDFPLGHGFQRGDVFLHITEVRDGLKRGEFPKTGDVADFAPVQTPRGVAAKNVVITRPL